MNVKILTVYEQNLNFFLFDENCVDEVSFKRWKQTDRSTLETDVENVDNFLFEFFTNLKFYQQHAFCNQDQCSYYRKTIENLTEGDVLVV